MYKQEFGHWYDPGRVLRKLIRRLEVQNSILAGFDVFHHIADSSEAVAWSVGKDIYFSRQRVPAGETREEIMFVTGLSNHELAHVLYTPNTNQISVTYPARGGYLMASKIKDNAAYRALFNIMEDGRIEMLMCKKYSNMRPYFISSFIGVVLADSTATHLDTAYILARGRRYLPVRIRKMLKKKFKRQDLIGDIRRIIDEYCTLNLYRAHDLQRADQLIDEMVKLVEDNNLWSDADDPHKQVDFDEMDPCGTVAVMVQDRNASGTPVSMDEVAETVAAVAADIKGQQGQSSDAEDIQGAADRSEGTGDDGNGGGPSAGNGLPDDEELTDDDIKRLLNEERVDQQGVEFIKRDLEAVEGYIRNTAEFDGPRHRTWTRVHSDLPAIARRTAKELQKLEEDADPSWDRYTNSGKLNVQRAMRNRDNTIDVSTAYDRWDEGGSMGSDQEWVILFDCSGSMDRQLGRLSKSAWVMKRAGDMVNATMTLITYGNNDSYHSVYMPTDRASATEMPIFNCLGGTAPAKALLQAHGILSKSRRAIKGLMIMTDGDWSANESGHPVLRSSHNIISSLNGMGVVTHLIYVSGGTNYAIDSHGCKTSGQINDVDDLPTVMKGLVSSKIGLKR